MATTAKFIFDCIKQGTHVLGTDRNGRDRMSAAIYFSVLYNDKLYVGGVVELNQPFGSDYEGDPIECHRPSMPQSMPRKLSPRHDDLNQAAERYYRAHVGSNSRSIGISKHARDVHMEGNMIISRAEFELPLDEGTRGW